VTAAWIDTAEDAVRLDPRATPDWGVCFRSDDGRWRVGVDDMRKPEETRRWLIWDMRGRAPALVQVPTPDGCASRDEAFRVASAYSRSRGLRIFVVLAATAFSVARLVARAARDIAQREFHRGPGIAPPSAPISPEAAADVASARGDQAGDRPPDLGEQSELRDGPVRRVAAESDAARRRRRRRSQARGG
jgi:hypothetical protein